MGIVSNPLPHYSLSSHLDGLQPVHVPSLGHKEEGHIGVLENPLLEPFVKDEFPFLLRLRFGHRLIIPKLRREDSIVETSA